MAELIQFSEEQLKLRAISPGATVEFDAPKEYTEEERRGHMELVTGRLVIAVDAILRSGTGNAPYIAADQIAQSLAEDGLAPKTPAPRHGVASDADIVDLLKLSAQLSQGLLHPEARPYTVGGFGTPKGGYTLFDYPAASRGYDYDSPMRDGGTHSAHWFKKTIQFISHGLTQMTVGVYVPGMQYIAPEKLAAELAQINQAEDEWPQLRMAEKQPVVVPKLEGSFNPYGTDRPVFHGVRLPGFAQGMHEAAKEHGFEFGPFKMRDPSVYGATAVATLMHKEDAIGLQISLRADQGYGDDKKPIAFKADASTDEYIVKDVEGNEAALENVSISAELIASGLYNNWSPLRQEENIYPDSIREDMPAFADVLTTLRTSIAARNA